MSTNLILFLYSVLKFLNNRKHHQDFYWQILLALYVMCLQVYFYDKTKLPNKCNTRICIMKK